MCVLCRGYFLLPIWTSHSHSHFLQFISVICCSVVLLKVERVQNGGLGVPFLGPWVLPCTWARYPPRLELGVLNHDDPPDSLGCYVGEHRQQKNLGSRRKAPL